MTIPEKLKKGDTIALIAPAESFLSNFTKEVKMHCIGILEHLGLKIKYGKYIDDVDLFGSASVKKRLEDFHNAWSDPEVKALMPISGGTTSNQLLAHLDYDLIKKNPKIFCGLSDNTNIQLAIYSLSNLVTYYGPHFSVFAASNNDDYTLEYFKKCLFSNEPYHLASSNKFLISEWDRKEFDNKGFWSVVEGETEGELLGGNLLTINFLQGSKFFPSLEGKILFLENNSKISIKGFFNQLQGLMNMKGFEKIKGLLIGRFQPESEVDLETITKAVKLNNVLNKIPVAANIDFGHTLPMVTLPVGGTGKIKVEGDNVEIVVTKH